LDKLQGAEFEDVCLDEGQQHQKIVFDKLKACCRSSIPGVVPTFCITGNPGGIGHIHLKQEFIEPARRGLLPPEMAFVQALVDDNPAVNKEYVHDLDSLPERLRKAWRMGDWTVFEGMFFPEFGEHLLEEPYLIPPHECNLYGSMDYGDGQGEKSGATSFGLWHVDKYGRSHRLLTYYKRHQTASVYAREIVATVQNFHWTSGIMPKEVHADPSIFYKKGSETQSIDQIFKDYGLNVVKANNERVQGWRLMRECLSKNDEGTPNSYYWGEFNSEYAEYIPTLIHDEHNPNDVHKGGEDHIGDESRYHFSAALSMKAKAIATEKKKAGSNKARRTMREFDDAFANSPAGVY
jgi:phage terminase large subunit